MEQKRCGYGARALAHIAEQKRGEEDGEVPPLIDHHRMSQGEDRGGDDPSPPQPYAQNPPPFDEDPVDGGLKVTPEIKFLRQGHQKNLKGGHSQEVRKPGQAQPMVVHHHYLPTVGRDQKRRKDDGRGHDEDHHRSKASAPAAIQKIDGTAPSPQHQDGRIEKQNGHDGRDPGAYGEGVPDQKQDAGGDHQGGGDYSQLQYKRPSLRFTNRGHLFSFLNPGAPPQIKPKDKPGQEANDHGYLAGG